MRVGLTQVSTQLQQTVPDQLRGRVMSLYSLCWNLLPLGGLLGGVLAAAPALPAAAPRPRWHRPS